MTTNSSIKGVNFTQRVREWVKLFAMRLRGLGQPGDFDWLWRDFAEYDRYCSQYCGTPLKDATILEIGFGARPDRLLALTSMGFKARGVDLDMPILRGTWKEFAALSRKNGYERLLKSVVRHFLFDWQPRRDLRRALAKKGHRLSIPHFPCAEFIIADAASLAMNTHIQPASLDFVFSEDVFEHIPAETLPTLLRNLSQWIKPQGLALIRPNVFTGITGGHLVEWYCHTINTPIPRQSEPWEHLRKKRLCANTFLNRLSLADYRRLFSESFAILEERVVHPDLGRQFLTPDVRQELIGFSEEELFSNQVLFVLQPKQHGSP